MLGPVHKLIHSWSRSTRQVIWPGSIDTREREKYKTMLNLVQAIEGKLPIHAERRRLCLMMLRLLAEGLADVTISLTALTRALLVSASRSNDNLARVRCLHHGDSRRRIPHLRADPTNHRADTTKHRSVLTVVLLGTEKDRMIIIEPDPSFSHTLSIGWKERNEKTFVDLSRLEKEIPYLGLSALITTHTYIPSLAEREGKADVAWQAGIAFAKASWLE